MSNLITCKTCEKLYVQKMKEKYKLFNIVYTVTSFFLKLLIFIFVPKNKRTLEASLIRKCITCEKIALHRLRDKSKLFKSVYKLLDATLEGWIDKFITKEEKKLIYKEDPIHTKELSKFNPYLYYLSENFILGIKFDECIATIVKNSTEIGPPVPNIIENIKRLKDSNIKIIIYGWRSNMCTSGNYSYKEEAETWLKQHNILYDWFSDGSSPIIADAFISNRNLGGDLNLVMEKILDKAQNKSNFVPNRHII